MNLRPIGDKIIIKADETSDKSAGGIILGTEEKPHTGTVVAVGEGAWGPDGKRIPISVKVGDRVAFQTAAIDEQMKQVIDGNDYYFTNELNLHGIIVD